MPETVKLAHDQANRNAQACKLPSERGCHPPVAIVVRLRDVVHKANLLSSTPLDGELRRLISSLPMPAYFRSSVRTFLNTSDDVALSKLTIAYAQDGYVSQYTSATVAWTLSLPSLRSQLHQLVDAASETATWQLLLEYPLYRLRRRIDAVLIGPHSIVVIEIKTAAAEFLALDKRQAVEYAQDLRDFHAPSKSRRLYPVLWAFEAGGASAFDDEQFGGESVRPLSLVGRNEFANAMLRLGGAAGFPSEDASEAYGRAWDEGAYRPVPSVIDAAVALFAGHGVREITIAGARNLDEVANTVLSIIESTRRDSGHSLVFLTGVPGAGKTLAGLNIVHSASEHGLSTRGDVVYLSGNTPLVVVLREALAQDRYAQEVRAGNKATIAGSRSFTRATIQHINDFLKEYVHGSTAAPSGHVIVFDEAQRAWNARQGKEKFGRDASEPQLALETMARHADWSVTVCLVGLGQEINDGEEGLAGWADAVEKLSLNGPAQWRVYAPSQAFGEIRSVGTLGKLPDGIDCRRNDALHLDVPMRSFRSPQLGEWVEALLSGDFAQARAVSLLMDFPLRLTRSLEDAKRWLKHSTKGHRRMGLLASSGARRLRADGIGETLSATDGSAIAHWYLKPPGDIRSSYALEVPANEYTSQGLEVDFACLCWGGDLICSQSAWISRRLGGNRWNAVSNVKGSSYILNSYRVLLSRAREGMVIWVPRGASDDHTRNADELDRVAERLAAGGVVPLPDGDQ